jgi:membrane fusion protein (multidrug efflux system)
LQKKTLFVRIFPISTDAFNDMHIVKFFALLFRMVLVIVIAFFLVLTGCDSPSPKNEFSANATPPSLPVLVVKPDSTTTYRDYTATIEGKINVEIRAQVDGYLDKIFVDEGAYVKAGQSLFKINDHTYREQLNTATASLHVAEANMNTAQIEVDKLTPLVKNNVISGMQLKTASSSYNASKAAVEQAKAAIASARINLDFTLIKAPVNGYISRIPKRIGTLVGRNDTEAMTMLSDIQPVYAYFSMSEGDFLHFNEHNKGNSLEEKIKQLRPVSLVIADGNIYPYKGKVDIVNGQFDKTTGAITLRATFPNPQKLLRSGNTGKIRLEEFFASAILIPISATTDQQDKIFVFALADSNKVRRQTITVSGKSGNNYIVSDGIKPGDKIVVTGVQTLTDGTVITPVPGNADAGKK